MNVVVLQPSYIPWRGYFHQIYKADVFVFYDDVQYDKGGWRNRNRIKTAQGTKWLTIPVHASGAQVDCLPINAVHIAWECQWNMRHWKSLVQSYRGRAPYFERYAPLLWDFYSGNTEMLSDFTIPLTVAIARELGIGHTRFLRASELNVTGQKTDRLVKILCKLGATHYISGPSARNYLEEDKLARMGVSLEYMEYNYPEYRQLYPPFDPAVSVLDLLFMTGPNALDYIVGASA